MANEFGVHSKYRTVGVPDGTRTLILSQTEKPNQNGETHNKGVTKWLVIHQPSRFKY